MNTLDLHRRVSDGFGQLVRQVAPGQWGLATPCSEWDVRALVNHLVAGNLFVPPLIAGAKGEEVLPLLRRDNLGEDPVAAWQRSADAAIAAFERPGALDSVVHHPLGDMPAQQFLFFRLTDNLVHAWDLARAIGADETLDPEAVAACYQAVKATEGQIPRGTVFAPRVEVPESLGQQAQLLGLLGRDPRRAR